MDKGIFCNCIAEAEEERKVARLSVLGLGYVGLVTASCFAKLGHKVVGVDKDTNKIDLLSRGIPTFFESGLDELLREGLDKNLLSFTSDINAAISQSEIIFICVGTPPERDGQADMSQVEEVARSIGRSLNGYKLIVEKSTVPAGTAKRIIQTIKLVNQDLEAQYDLASNPEFLKEGSAVRDFLQPDRVVLGADSDRARKLLLELYRDFKCPVLTTDVITAELIKHASNAFLAMKISFINLVADICEKVNADISLVAEGLGYDKRIGRDFLNAGAGYGGSCFPKDLKALAAMAGALGINTSLFKDIDLINEKRINSILYKLEDALWVCKNKTIAVFGLAFKSNTDDIRESPGLKLVFELIKKGARVVCFDPKAMDNAKNVLNSIGDLVIFAETPYQAAKTADALVFMTEWPEFTKLDFQKLKNLMRLPVIIDGRNMLSVDKIEKYGFWYSRVGGIKTKKDFC